MIQKAMPTTSGAELSARCSNWISAARPIRRAYGGSTRPGRYLVGLRWEDGTETPLAGPASDARLEIDIAEALSRTPRSQ